LNGIPAGHGGTALIPVASALPLGTNLSIVAGGECFRLQQLRRKAKRNLNSTGSTQTNTVSWHGTGIQASLHKN